MTLIEPRPDFPVAWPSPDAPHLLWEYDAMHCPEQLTALEQGFAALSMTHGFMRAAQTYELPIEAVRVLWVRGWPYHATISTPGTPTDLDLRAAQAHRRLMTALPDLGSLWSSEVLPAVQAELAAIGAPLDGLDGAALANRFDDAVARFIRIWELHFVVVLPAYTAISEFDELYRELFEDATSLDALQLLGGQLTLSTTLTEQLWALAFRASAEIREILSRRSTNDIEAALNGVEGAAEFRADLAAFLDNWGDRIDMWDRISQPSWREAPTIVLGQLKDLAMTPIDRSPSAALGRARRVAEQGIISARAKLAGYPAQVRELFETLLQAARVALVITEDHSHHIDFAATPRLRELALAAGSLLAESDVIDSPSDVFHLGLNTVLDQLRTPSDARADVRSAQAELAAGAAQTPPPMLGTIPQDRLWYSVTTYQSKFFGEVPPPSIDGELSGSPGSPGRVTGTARIVDSLAEATRLAAGDVLVCTTAAPLWTSLFATAAAVVTDTGGPLCHCAVVARELGIPAVVGTQNATTLIRDGQEIDVDGDAGVVYLR